MHTRPVAIIGGGPVGLAAAAHLVARQQPFMVLERGAEAGASIREWSHVRTFSPWRYMVDAAARDLLTSSGWQAPDPEALPTGADLIDQYLAPLSRHQALSPHIRFHAEVVAIGRKDFDKVRTKGRDEQPFEIRLANGESIEARAVIDASGTWSRPNPAGSGGVAAAGELASHARIAYGIPDVLDRGRSRYAGKSVLLVGSGHSAFNVVLDMLRLADASPHTRITWAMRKDSLDTVFGGGASDELSARGALGQRARRAVESGRIRLLTPYRLRSLTDTGAGLSVLGSVCGEDASIDVDHVIVCTGFRPDLQMLSEVRLGLDSWLECPAALAPLIDPNEHSCGTVRPHGARELAHPEKDFYIVGMKSYGRAPTFLMATGYEQVRSVVAMLAGDVAAAERVELVLPETGVCSTDTGGGGCCDASPKPVAVPLTFASKTGKAPVADACCGGPAPAGVDACCVKDADAKAAGDVGCGC